MYVLCAMEIVRNHQNLFSATQLAAMRVDENWVRKDTFHSPIEPLDASFHQWQDPAFTGYTKQEFLNALNAHLVLKKFEKWLRDDDVLCWWNLTGQHIFIKFYGMTMKSDPSYKMLGLRPYFHMVMQDNLSWKGSVYKLSRMRDISVAGEEHCSLDTVYAMSSFLRTVGFEQNLLLSEPSKRVIEHRFEPENGHKYVYQPETGLFHHIDCLEIRRDCKMEGYGSIGGCMRRHFKPCSVCVLKEVNAWRKEKNKDSIERSWYAYIYAENGEVFHRRSCAYALRVKCIAGSISYGACVQKGMRPCSVCNPEPEAKEYHKGKKAKAAICQSEAVKKVKETKPKRIRLFRSNWLLSAEENKALERLEQAQKERLPYVLMKNMSKQEKADHLTLTHPGYAFFSGTGYQSFHLRTCSALDRLTEIRGFSTYEQAEAAGKTPCKICKPTPKADLDISIPFGNMVRENESESTLVSLCEAKQIAYRYEEPYFYMETSVGKWKIDTVTRPVIVHHINLTKKPNQTEYHRQHRLFLSLKDTFDYIYKHDHAEG